MIKTLDIPAFNLIDELWIPCIKTDGTTVELNLKETLLNAHQLRCIYGESPLIVASLYRLLLAMMYSIHGSPSIHSWKSLWEQGKYDCQLVEDYFEKWYERFYLFHPERPFYQWTDDRVKPKQIDTLLHENASGINATLFDHSTKETQKHLTPEEAARTLLSAQTFGISGPCNPKLKLYYSNSPWTSGVVFLLEGKTLFETLLLNWFKPPPEMFGDSTPFWENNNPFSNIREIPEGYSDYLTWPSRRIMLLPEISNQEKIFVSQVTESPGLVLDSMVLDPSKHYTTTDQGGNRVTKFGEARALWRDSASIIEISKQKEIKAPLSFDWMAKLMDRGYFPEDSQYQVLALGMAAGRLDMEVNASAGKVHFYRYESFTLHGAYLQNPELTNVLQNSIEAAENVRKKLGGSLVRMATLILSPKADAEGGRRPDKKDVQNMIAHWAAERDYWSALETPFFQLMYELPIKGEGSLNHWDIVLQRTAWTAFDHAARMAGNDARALRASVRARRQLAGGLKKLFAEI